MALPVQRWLRMAAANPKVAAPQSFRDAYDHTDAPKDFVRFAWRLFKDTVASRGEAFQKPPTREEVYAYIKKRKQTVVDTEAVDESKVGCVESHFLDSGSFTLWTKAAEWAKANGRRDEDFYKTKEFHDYMDSYAEFVKKYQVGIDLYANVDAIGYPERTWNNQRYLEEVHELLPVPVVHYRTDLKWLLKYMNSGKYEVIALGGLVGSTDTPECRAWLDRAFEIVCDQPSRLPRVKIHGFGVTTYDLLLRYPWYSVDSTSWTKVGAFGGILVPHRRGGKWDFSEAPYIMKVSNDSPDKKARGKHVMSLNQMERDIIVDWLAEIGVPMGRFAPDGVTVEEHGVITRHSERKVANLLFFEMFRAWLPAYPWAFHLKKKPTMGIF